MPGLADFGENDVLDHVYNTADRWFSLHSADPGDTGSNELSGSGYGRIQVPFNSAASGLVDNTGAMTWSVPPGNVVAWGAWSASTGGNLYQTGWLVPTSGKLVDLALVRAGSDVTNNDLQSNAHGLAAGDRVVFEVIEQLTLPAGLSAGTIYFVIATGLTTDAFRVSTSSGGAAVDISGAGSAIWRKVLVTTFSVAGTFQIAAGALDVFATE